MSEQQDPEGYISASVFAKLRELPAEQVVKLIRDGVLSGRRIDEIWYVDKAELHKNSESKPKAKSRAGFWFLIFLIAIPSIAALLRYGTLSPCGMLKKEFQIYMMDEMGSIDTSDTWGAAGFGLGTMLADNMVGGVVGGMTPLECARGLVNYWTNSDISGSLAINDSYLSDDYYSSNTVDSTPEIPTWRSRTEKSPIDDSTNVYLWINGNEPIHGWIDKKTASLNIRCKENKTEMYINFDMQLSSDYDRGYRSTKLRLRYDETPALTRRYGLSTNGEAVYVNKAISTIRKMLNHETLLVEVTPFQQGSQTTTFDLNGLSDVIGPLQKACHWQ